jgi:hypothetical protein
MVTPIAFRWLLNAILAGHPPHDCEMLLTWIPRGMFSTQMYVSPRKWGISENSPVLRISRWVTIVEVALLN